MGRLSVCPIMAFISVVGSFFGRFGVVRNIEFGGRAPWKFGASVSGTVMRKQPDRRVEELDNLRVALSTFAVQLDAFEARLKISGRKPIARPSKPISPDPAFAKLIVAAMSDGARPGREPEA